MNKKGFTLIEIIVSLFLLSIFVTLLAAIINLTATISKSMLDFTDYEYALMHKNMMDYYEESDSVNVKNNKIYFSNKEEDWDHEIVFTSKKIYKKTRNKGNYSARGYSLLLENITSYEINSDNNFSEITIVDRGGKKRTLRLRLKDEEKEKKELEEKKKKEKEENEKKKLEEENKDTEEKQEISDANEKEINSESMNAG